MQFSVHYVAAFRKTSLKSIHLSQHPNNYATELEINDFIR